MCRRTYGSVPIPFRGGLRIGGRFRLIVETGALRILQQLIERLVIATLHCGAQCFLHSVIARNKCGIDLPHCLRAFGWSHRFLRKARLPLLNATDQSAAEFENNSADPFAIS